MLFLLVQRQIKYVNKVDEAVAVPTQMTINRFQDFSILYIPNKNCDFLRNNFMAFELL